MGVDASAVSTAAAHPDVETVLLGEEQIRRRVRELAAQISADFRDQELHVVGVLRGAAVFAADLIRELKGPTTLDFIAISSYGADSRTSGVVKIVKDLDETVQGRNVLVVEDIVDTGLTLNYLVGMLRERRAARLEVCALLDKPEARLVPTEVRYVGFRIPNRFVVGYGLDYRQRYRGLPYIGTLRPHVYGGD